MAAPTGVTHTFVADTPAEAAEVNQNFTDILNWVTDGSKDLTFNSVTLTADLTVGGNVDSNLDPNTDATYRLGTSSFNWIDLFLDNGGTDGGQIHFDAGTTTLTCASDSSYVELDSGNDTELRIDANTGDAKISLRVNNAAANTWDIYNDNGSSDALDFDYNGTTMATLETTAQGTLNIYGDAAAATTFINIENANTGDAALRLTVNGASANAWDIRNDNDASDSLKFQYNGTTKMYIDTDGDFVVDADTDDAEVLINAQAANQDAVLTLRVNNATANEWELRNDNSVSDRLLFRYGDTEKARLDTSGGFVGYAFTATAGAGGGSPTADTVYSDNIIKAYAYTNSAGTIQQSMNLTCSRVGAGIYSYTIGTNMADANYAATATPDGNNGEATIGSRLAGSFRVLTNTGAAADLAHSVIICGGQ